MRELEGFGAAVGVRARRSQGGSREMQCYCWNCFRLIGRENDFCPHCKQRQLPVPGGLEEKLLRALAHPRPEVRRRAVFALGEKRQKKAADALMRLVESDPDPYVAAEAVEALKKIGGNEGDRARALASHHRSAVVRLRAAQCFKNPA